MATIKNVNINGTTSKLSAGVYDVSEQNNGKQYNSIEEVLTNNAADIPQNDRIPGMEIQFILSSTQEYAKYKYTHASLNLEYFTDKDNWQSLNADEEPGSYSENLVKSGGVASVNGHYIESDEYLRVITDEESRILFGIKRDGNVFFGCDVPQQVKDYVSLKIDELGLEDYEDIVAFLDDIEHNDKTLQDYLNEKVDKEDGKGLITKTLCDETDSDDTLYMLTDNSGKIILNIDKDGTFNWYKGIPNHLKEYFISINGDNDEIGIENLSAILNAVSSFGNKLIPLNIEKDENGWEVVKTLEIQKCLLRASYYTKIEWTPSSNVPKRTVTSVDEQFPANTKVRGIPYSSVGQRAVGHNVSFHTFMTAVNNPFSLLYTEDTSAKYNRSIWGNSYDGATNARTYYGATCTNLTGYCIGLDYVYPTTLYPWSKNYNLETTLVYKNNIDKVSLGDIILYISKGIPSHARLITGIKRDENNAVTNLKISELGSPAKEQSYTRQQIISYIGGENIDDVIDSDTGGYGLFYRPLTLYKLMDVEHERVDVFDANFEYNNDICTFAGDRCSFLTNDLIVLNYNLKNSNNTWTYIEIYDDNDVLKYSYQISNIDQTQLPESQRYHALNLGRSHEPGIYKAKLSNGMETSDFTYWEVLDFELSFVQDNETKKVHFNFSSEYAKLVIVLLINASDGKGYAYYQTNKTDFEIDFVKLNKQQLPFRLISKSANYYIGLCIEGKYGRKSNFYKNKLLNF